MKWKGLLCRCEGQWAWWGRKTEALDGWRWIKERGWMEKEESLCAARTRDGREGGSA
jgi:hypothetical protein